ncbi:MAG: DNA topology modulation protein [Dehalococcoidia bacterium]
MAKSASPVAAAPAAVSMRRIAVIGCAGAGKSVFSRELGERLGMPVTHLDTVYWRPGWNETPKTEWRETMDRLVEDERWLIDGNYGGTMDQRLRAADTVVYLDTPRRVCLWRVVKRWATYRHKSRPDMAEGCPERMDFKFLRWIWQYPGASRPKTLAALESKEQLGGQVYVLRSKDDIQRFLRIAAPATQPDVPTSSPDRQGATGL